MVGEARLLFVPDGRGGIHEWTDIASMDRGLAFSGRTYFWVPRVLVHEFGHAFGLADRYKEALHHDPLYIGIMNRNPAGDNSIKDDDREALMDIYRTHTKGAGW